ncbi:erythromycin esterase family protein [Nocardia sp. NPDC088792]|uniref:erythromycin esterase family protein n=1 Tax=Nocardia sp. NPDC088792 TaxID=3364332 RepID=UPI0037FDCE14
MSEMTDTAAHPIARLLAERGPVPFDAAAGRELAASLATATVVGLGESTRFSREIAAIQEQLFRELVSEHGFRVLALQDSADVAARLDAYVRAGAGTAEEALATAWRPNRTAQVAAVLEWIRDFNRRNENDRIRVIAVKPFQATTADYDTVLDAVRAVSVDRIAEVAAIFDVIRTAHATDEHVQRARGMYSGAPFAEQARAAADVVNALPVPADARERMALIVGYHENSVAGRGSFAGEAEIWAGSIIDDHARHGQRIVYWDGIAHVSAAPFTLGMAAGEGAQPTIGSVLHARFGDGYAAVAIGFDHGDLGVVVVPPAAPDFLDHELSTADAPVHWVDLRPEPVRAVTRVPAKMRVIAGVYDPARDESAYMTVDSLSDSFGVLVHVRSASAVTWLA